MAERRRRPNDPYHNWMGGAGRENFNRLFLAEVRTMADNHSKDVNYRRFRRHAVEFIERRYTPPQFDALIPYMAMTFVDRVHFDGQIPTVIDPPGHNIDLFLICCLIISWKLRTKRFVLQSFLTDQHLNYISVDKVIDMESRICIKLGWRLRTVTPFWFIDFFTPFISFPSNPSSTLRIVYQLIVKAQCDIAFTEFRPSVMAASAMQIVTTKVLPDQVEAFENFVIKSELLAPVKDQILRCRKMLEKMYDGPSTASIDPAPVDRGGASSSAVPTPTSQIPRREGKEPAATNDEDPTHGEGEHPAIDDQDREGGVDEETGIGRYFEGEDNIDDLMNFRLGWIAALTEMENNNRNLCPIASDDGDHLVSYLAGRFCGCCNIV